jgi:ABC-type transporter Mla subunit MlaD
MRLPTPDPRQLRDLASTGLRTGRDALAVVPRIEVLLDTAEVVLQRLAGVVARLEEVEARAQAVIDRVDDARERARDVIDRTAVLGARVGDVFDAWAPTLERAQPVMARLGETWGVAEADALTASVHAGARVNEQLQDELIPAVRTLRSVAPDLAELVTTSKALNEIIATVPGLGRAKKRAEESVEADGH